MSEEFKKEVKKGLYSLVVVIAVTAGLFVMLVNYVDIDKDFYPTYFKDSTNIVHDSTAKKEIDLIKQDSVQRCLVDTLTKIKEKQKK